LCELIPQVDSRTRVLLLQHPSEVNHALNTARLAALGLTNAQLLVGEVFEDLATLLNPPGYRARLLFPGEDAQLIEADTVDGQQLPMLLVVPDGTWRKARKLLHLNPLLAQLPRVTLPEGRCHVTGCARRRGRGPVYFGSHCAGAGNSGAGHFVCAAAAPV
jgi:Uncharacterized conserved protein